MKSNNVIIQDKFELAYFMVDTLGVKVMELLYPQDNNKSRWFIINKFEKRDESNPNAELSGIDITDFFLASRLNKPGDIIKQELLLVIEEKKMRNLKFSEHFSWFMYK